MGACALVEQDIKSPVFGRRIEVARWFVRQQIARLGDERPAEGRPLLLSMGQPSRAVVKPMSEAGLPRQDQRARADGVGKDQSGVDAVGQEDVLQDIQEFEQLEILKDQPEVGDTKGAPAGVIKARRLDLAHGDVAFVREKNTGDQVEQGGLARAARANQGGFLSSGDG